MRRRLPSLMLTAGLLATSVVAAPAQAPARPQPAPITPEQIQDVLTRYAAGQDDAVSIWITPAITPWARGAWTASNIAALRDIVTRSALPQRVKLAFVIDIVVALRSQWMTPQLLDLGRALFAEGPALGSDPASDRFEVLWHQLAVAVLQGWVALEQQARYLDEVEPRFTQARQRGSDIDTRFPLARAIVAAGQCCVDMEQGYLTSSGWRVTFRGGATRQEGSREGAVLLFERAAAVPSLRAEALIRGGVLLFQGGRHKQAVEWFAQVPPHDDEWLAFVQHLIHGRTLDAVGNAHDAAAAYQRALETLPSSQSASIGLAAALLRGGHADAAAVVAAQARRQPAAVEVPYLTFHMADARFIPAWLAEIRGLR